MFQSNDKIPILRELTDDDVLLGRGFPSIEHEGNCRWRELVRSRSSEYHAAYRRHTKDSIAREVVNTIEKRKGKFLTQLDPVPNIRGLVIPAGARVWTEADEGVVLVKAKQAWRDHSNEASKDGKPFARRRPAAGSGNVVLEWITPTSSSTISAQSGGNQPLTIPAPTNPQSSPSTSGGASSSNASNPQQSVPNILSAQQSSFLGQDLSRLGSLPLPGAMGATGNDSQMATLLAALSSQQQSLLHAGGTPFLQTGAAFGSPALQVALQQLLGSQSLVNFAGGTSNNSNTGSSSFATVSQATTQNALSLLQTNIQGKQPPPLHQQLSTNSSSAEHQERASVESAGSRAHAVIRRSVEKFATRELSSQGTSGLSLCGLEVCLLNVLCSFGLPYWNTTSRETALTNCREEGSLHLSWVDLGKKLLPESQKMGLNLNALVADARTMAMASVFLVRRCLECCKKEDPAAEARSSREDANPLSEVDFDVVRNVSTQWSMEIGNCCGLDGSYLTGTILETLAFELEDPHDTGTGRRAPPVASILQYTDCRTIIATIATLIQLQWIFQHPTPTIFQLLSSQEGSDPSRDFLLLKGVLEHGLANELEFRVQGTSMTRSEVENRIVLFTKVLFKRLQALEKQETIRSLKRKYSTLLGA